MLLRKLLNRKHFDKVVPGTVREEFFTRLSTPHCKRYLVADALHEILLEPSWPETSQEIKNWLEQF